MAITTISGRTPAQASWITWPNTYGEGQSHTESDSWLLGCVGRLGTGWYGFVYLCFGPCSFASGATAQFGNSCFGPEHRVLWRPAVRAVLDRVGFLVSVGTHGRPLRARAHADVD